MCPACCENMQCCIDLVERLMQCGTSDEENRSFTRYPLDLYNALFTRSTAVHQRLSHSGPNNAHFIRKVQVRVIPLLIRSITVHQGFHQCIRGSISASGVPSVHQGFHQCIRGSISASGVPSVIRGFISLVRNI